MAKNDKGRTKEKKLAQMTTTERLYAGCRTNPRAGPQLEKALKLAFR